MSKALAKAPWEVFSPPISCLANENDMRQDESQTKKVSRWNVAESRASTELSIHFANKTKCYSAENDDRHESIHFKLFGEMRF